MLPCIASKAIGDSNPEETSGRPAAQHTWPLGAAGTAECGVYGRTFLPGCNRRTACLIYVVLPYIVQVLPRNPA
ncbi:hypothetical protein ACFO9Q_04500 [Paenibacillus sp. GCM10023252]|uniref:hypothetical protein n=1 Tax=Paenibacillus sp. GCM10023252 TaxID=3252649 RepID=UPI0036141A91